MKHGWALLAPLLLMLVFILVVAFMPMVVKPRPSVAGRGQAPLPARLR